MTSPVSESYEPLADGHIRLLELNLEYEHDIVGHLRSPELTSAPAYYALSYVCGDGPYEHEVTINDIPFKVKPNLHAALRRLQTYFRSAGILRVLIWIDAICIDQDNADEKAKHIQGMHDTFTRAEMVLIALGPVPENVHMVLSIYSWTATYAALDPPIRCKILERLAQMQEHDHREPWVGHLDLQLAREIERLEYVTKQLRTRHEVNLQSLLAMQTLLGRLELFGIGIDSHGKMRSDMSSTDFEEKLRLAVDLPYLTDHLFHPNHSFWAGVYALSEIEWYQRVWTYQEIVLARDAEVFTEGLSVNWNHVVAPTAGLLWAMEKDAIFEKIDAKVTVLGLPTYYVRGSWHFTWANVSGSEYDVGKESILELLVSTRNRKSTLAKDKVYGLLAVARSDVRAQIPIDYTATDGEVFASAVKAELKISDDATIVRVWNFFDSDYSAMQGLPSWCPNFASMSGPQDPARHYAPAAFLKQFEEFACYEHTPGFQTIRVKLFKLDTIAGGVGIACPLDENTRPQLLLSSDSEASRTVQAALDHWLVQIRAVFSDDGSALGLTRGVTQSLLEFLHGIDEHSSLLSIETFWETLNHMLSFIDSGRQPSHAYDRLRDSAEYRYTLGMLSSQRGRYLFKTNSGEIGFSTRRPVPGNHVVILPGSSSMHMLTGDCTQYSGCVTLSRMWNPIPLLALVVASGNMWEMVELR